MPKIRYNGKPEPEEQCHVDGCRIRGRYIYKKNRICYGHLSKIALDHFVETGVATDAPHATYIPIGRKKKGEDAKRKFTLVQDQPDVKKKVSAGTNDGEQD
jgi:hypothetical protein